MTTEIVSENNYLTADCNKNLNDLPGDYGIPLLGNNLTMIKDPIKFLKDRRETYGDVSRAAIADFHCVMVYGPELAQKIVLDKERNFSVRRGWEILIPEFFKGGLLHKDYEDHRIQRRIMQSAFKSESLKGYTDVIIAEARSHVAQWGKKKNIIFFDEIKQLLLDIAFKVFCIVGESDQGRARVNKDFSTMMKGASAMMQFNIPGTAYYKGLKSRRSLEDYFREKVDMKRNSNDPDAFTHFCKEKKDDGEYFTHDEIANHMVFLMLGAHDTTASTLSMAAFHLAYDMDLQDKYLEEINRLDTAINYEAIKDDMPFGEQVFHETLRLHPAVPMYFRRTIRDCEIGGYHVPAHTMVMVPTIYNHRHPDVWSEAEKYSPERFGENGEAKKLHSFSWFPFGGGAHKCIGLNFAEILFKVTLHELLREYKITYTDPSFIPEESEIAMFPFPKPKDHLPLTLSKR